MCKAKDAASSHITNYFTLGPPIIPLPRPKLIPFVLHFPIWILALRRGGGRMQRNPLRIMLHRGWVFANFDIVSQTLDLFPLQLAFLGPSLMSNPFIWAFLGVQWDFAPKCLNAYPLGSTRDWRACRLWTRLYGIVVAEREGEGERICHAQIGAVSKWPH